MVRIHGKYGVADTEAEILLTVGISETVIYCLDTLRYFKGSNDAISEWLIYENYGNQEKLTSAVNIKTINKQSLLGSGNIVISGGSSNGYFPSGW